MTPEWSLNLLKSKHPSEGRLPGPLSDLHGFETLGSQLAQSVDARGVSVTAQIHTWLHLN